MSVSNISWNEIKEAYKKNLDSLKGSATMALNSTVTMNRIYSKVMEKAHDTSDETLNKFAELWYSNIDFENLESSSMLKNDFETLLRDSTQNKFQNFGSSLQQQVYKKSITGLDDYRITMQAFYDTWKNMWPN